MGRQNIAASVSWTNMSAAIQANSQKDVSLQGGASASLAALPAEMGTGLPLGSGWTEDTTFTVTDALSFALWSTDPLYRIANPAIRRSMEMEEAATLLHASESAWKLHNGRVRGWIRKHLEEDLRLRSGGGEPQVDAWEAIRTTKRAALLLDYICVSKGLRLALWWPDQKMVTVVPHTSEAKQISQINCLSGRMQIGPAGELKIATAAWPALILGSDISWSPPASAPSIGTHTVAQILERIQAMKNPGTIVRTGGRIALWNRLMWLTLTENLTENLAENCDGKAMTT